MADSRLHKGNAGVAAGRRLSQALAPVVGLWAKGIARMIPRRVLEETKPLASQRSGWGEGPVMLMQNAMTDGISHVNSLLCFIPSYALQ